MVGVVNELPLKVVLLELLFLLRSIPNWEVDLLLSIQSVPRHVSFIHRKSTFGRIFIRRLNCVLILKIHDHTSSTGTHLVLLPATVDSCSKLHIILLHWASPASTITETSVMLCAQYLLISQFTACTSCLRSITVNDITGSVTVALCRSTSGTVAIWLQNYLCLQAHCHTSSVHAGRRGRRLFGIRGG